MGSLPRHRAGPANRIEVAEATADFDAVLARVAAGEEIVLARDGMPVARLVPETAAEPRAEPPPPGDIVEQFRTLRSETGPEASDAVTRLRALRKETKPGPGWRELRDFGRR